MSPEAVNFVIALTEKRPDMRLSAEEALEHPWFRSKFPYISPLNLPFPSLPSASGAKEPLARERGISGELMNRMKGGEKESSVLEAYTSQEGKVSEERQSARNQMVLRELRLAEETLQPSKEQSQV